MSGKKKRGLKDLLAIAKRHLSVAERQWEKVVNKIRTNPNQMNPDGIWVEDMLRGLQNLRLEMEIHRYYILTIKGMIKEGR